MKCNYCICILIINLTSAVKLLGGICKVGLCDISQHQNIMIIFINNANDNWYHLRN